VRVRKLHIYILYIYLFIYTHIFMDMYICDIYMIPCRLALEACHFLVVGLCLESIWPPWGGRTQRTKWPPAWARMMNDANDFQRFNNASELNWPWWRALYDLTLHNCISQKNWPWWRLVCDFTSHNNISEKNWPWWRVVCDFTLHSITSDMNWPWWREVCDFAAHNNA
jgi:hypothetical protein